MVSSQWITTTKHLSNSKEIFKDMLSLTLSMARGTLPNSKWLETIKHNTASLQVDMLLNLSMLQLVFSNKY
jgi:hypothetical protein